MLNVKEKKTAFSVVTEGNEGPQRSFAAQNAAQDSEEFYAPFQNKMTVSNMGMPPRADVSPGPDSGLSAEAQNAPDEGRVLAWDKNMETETQKSIDRVLDYLVEKALVVSVKAQGGPIHVCAYMAEKLQAAVPPALRPDVDVLLQHLIDYLCDYCETTGTANLSLNFEFKRG